MTSHRRVADRRRCGPATAAPCRGRGHPPAASPGSKSIRRTSSPIRTRPNCFAIIAHDYPISVHTVGVSIGSAGGIDRAHLARVRGARRCARSDSGVRPSRLVDARRRVSQRPAALALRRGDAAPGRAACRRGTGRTRPPLSRGKPVELCRLRHLDHDRGRISLGACPPHRLQAAVRRQQHLSQCPQHGLRSRTPTSTSCQPTRSPSCISAASPPKQTTANLAATS